MVCFVASSILAVVVTTRWAEQREREHLDEVVSAITDSGFPLSSTVLRRMSALSAAELVVIDGAGRAVTGPSWLGNQVEPTLAELPSSKQHEIWSQPVIELAGRSFFAARVPLVSQSFPGCELSMVVLYPEDRWVAMRNQLMIGPLVVGLIGIVVLSVAVTLAARRVVAPLEGLRKCAMVIAEGNFAPISLPNRNDEVRDLTVALNAMAEQLSQYEITVRQNERLRTLGQIGGGLAHQLRNAATGARMALDLHARSCPSNREDPSVGIAVRQLMLMEVTIQRILTLGQPRRWARDSVCLSSLVAETVELLSPAFQHADVALGFVAPNEALIVSGDTKALEQVTWNLLFNALEAVQQTIGDRDVSVTLEHGPSDIVRFVVEDSGCGPADAMTDRLFEPFATDKPDGTGLGLAVVKTIVEEHSGTLEWQRVDRRTRFIVELPLIEVGDLHGTPAHCG